TGLRVRGVPPRTPEQTPAKRVIRVRCLPLRSRFGAACIAAPREMVIQEYIDRHHRLRFTTRWRGGNRLVSPRHYSPRHNHLKATRDPPRLGEGLTARTNRRLPVSIVRPPARLSGETFGCRRRMRARVVRQLRGVAD